MAPAVSGGMKLSCVSQGIRRGLSAPAVARGRPGGESRRSGRKAAGASTGLTIGLPVAAHYGFTYVQPCSCSSITRTTPDFTTSASEIRGTSLLSALLIFSRVLAQASNEIDGVLSAMALILALTGEVSSAAYAGPGRK